MAPKKGGGFVETMVASGIGAYAAKNSSSMKTETPAGNVILH
jgi:hypothetical protein